MRGVIADPHVAEAHSAAEAEAERVLSALKAENQ